MIIQAAKIIGSGLATIGLTNILLSVIQNDNVLISKIIYTELIKKAISTIETMVQSLPLKCTLLKFLEEEIRVSTLEIKAKREKGYISTQNFFSLPIKTRLKLKPLKNNFNIAGVYVFSAPNGEQYVGSCIDFNSRLIEHKDQFNNRRRPTKLHLRPPGGLGLLNINKRPPGGLGGPPAGMDH